MVAKLYAQIRRAFCKRDDIKISLLIKKCIVHIRTKATSYLDSNWWWRKNTRKAVPNRLNMGKFPESLQTMKCIAKTLNCPRNNLKHFYFYCDLTWLMSLYYKYYVNVEIIWASKKTLMYKPIDSIRIMVPKLYVLWFTLVCSS